MPRCVADRLGNNLAREDAAAHNWNESRTGFETTVMGVLRRKLGALLTGIFRWVLAINAIPIAPDHVGATRQLLTTPANVASKGCNQCNVQ